MILGVGIYHIDYAYSLFKIIKKQIMCGNQYHSKNCNCGHAQDAPSESLHFKSPINDQASKDIWDRITARQNETARRQSERNCFRRAKFPL